MLVSQYIDQYLTIHTVFLFVIYYETIPAGAVQVASVPLHVPSSPQVLLSLPVNSYPSSHMKTQKSPGSGSPSSPSEQSIIPSSGAVSGGHVTPTAIIKNKFNEQIQKYVRQ